MHAPGHPGQRLTRYQEGSGASGLTGSTRCLDYSTRKHSALGYWNGPELCASSWSGLHCIAYA